MTGLLRAAAYAVAAGLLLAACGSDDGEPAGKVRVVTTLPLFADFVREAGGDRVEVSSLLPSGADPHTWEPSPRDVKRLTEADLVFANGLGLEAAALKIIEANVEEDAVTLLGSYAIGTGIIYEGMDPHLWMDPEIAERYISRISLDLARVDPGGAEAYTANSDRYLAALREAGVSARTSVAGIPSGNRKLVTTHDAFGYFARALGLEVVAFVAAGPGQEPSPGDVADLARAIKREGVSAVFAEPQTGTESDILRQAAADAGVQVCTLYSDSLDDRVTSYVGLLRFNADELARCLGGDDGT